MKKAALCTDGCILLLWVLGLVNVFAPSFPPWKGGFAALFFLFMGLRLILAWGTAQKSVLRRFRIWSALVLGSFLGFLILLAVITAMAGPAWLIQACGLLMAIIAVPLNSCSVMVWPIFGWACILLASSMMLHTKTGD